MAQRTDDKRPRPTGCLAGRELGRRRLHARGAAAKADVARHATSAVNLLACRRAVGEEAAKLCPDLFVTLAFNRSTTLDRAMRALDDFHAHVDRRLLGHDWHKRVGRRTRFMAVAENVGANLHLHLLVAPADGEWWKFCKAAVRAWSRIAPAGSADIRPVSNPIGAAAYMLKRVTLDTFDRLQFSRGYFGHRERCQVRDLMHTAHHARPPHEKGPIATKPAGTSQNPAFLRFRRNALILLDPR